MVLAQIILILPIIISISFETLESIYFEYEEMLKSLRVNFRDSILIIYGMRDIVYLQLF